MFPGTNPRGENEATEERTAETLKVLLSPSTNNRKSFSFSLQLSDYGFSLRSSSCSSSDSLPVKVEGKVGTFCDASRKKKVKTSSSETDSCEFL